MTEKKFDAKAALKEMKLTADQIKIVGSMTDDEVEFLFNSEADQRLVIISQMAQSAIDSEELGKNIDFTSNLFGGNKPYRLGEMMFRKGVAFRAQFMGLIYLWSASEKEHWPKIVSEDGTNEKYRGVALNFRQTDGSIIQVFPSTMLANQVRNILTKSSGSNVDSDPILTITYDGKLDDKAVLKEVYKFETTEKTAHATTLEFEKSRVRFGTGRGVLNPLNSPELPNLVTYDEDMESSEITANNYEALQANIATRNVEIEAAKVSQIQQ